MKTHRLKPLVSTCLGVALVASAAAAHAAVGARVLLQEWTPTAPGEQRVRVLANDPSVMSDAVQRAWAEARPRICTALRNAMGKGGAAKGQTLYDITCKLDESATFTVASAGPNALSAALAISGYVEATSTTPTPLGGDVDPRFSVALTARVLLALSVQPSNDQTLRIDKAQFRLSDATLDSHNLTGDLLKFVAEDLSPFFKGPNYRRLAESAIDSIGIDLTRRFNGALAPVNALLHGPSGAVRVAVWGKPDAVVIAFGPREFVPQLGGTMSGALRADSTKIVAAGICESFHIDASVQTGPAPLRDPSGYYEPGDAPRRKLGSFQAVPMADGECRYRLDGMAVGWPNSLATSSTINANKTAGNSVHSTHYTLVGDGWDGHTAVPQPAIERNYVIRTAIEGSAVLDPAATLKHGAVNPADPRIQVIDRVMPEAAASTAQGAVVGQGKQAVPPKAASRFGSTRARTAVPDAVSLNPQPLPPDPDPLLPPSRLSPIRPITR
ncbi:MAG TPA: hypothetical protein VLW55_28665 [Burkholderiaceae bacterium]|nr:hypothetical protein [Burkholderiaceae bacterium]